MDTQRPILPDIDGLLEELAEAEIAATRAGDELREITDKVYLRHWTSYPGVSDEERTVRARADMHDDPQYQQALAKKQQAHERLIRQRRDLDRVVMHLNMDAVEGANLLSAALHRVQTNVGPVASVDVVTDASTPTSSATTSTDAAKSGSRTRRRDEGA